MESTSVSSGRTHSSNLPVLGRNLATIMFGDFTSFEKFVNANPGIFELDPEDFVTEAIRAYQVGETAYERACVQATILLKRLRNLASEEIEEVFDDLQDEESDELRQFYEQTDKVLRRVWSSQTQPRSQKSEQNPLDGQSQMVSGRGMRQDRDFTESHRAGGIVSPPEREAALQRETQSRNREVSGRGSQRQSRRPERESSVHSRPPPTSEDLPGRPGGDGAWDVSMTSRRFSTQGNVSYGRIPTLGGESPGLLTSSDGRQAVTPGQPQSYRTQPRIYENQPRSLAPHPGATDQNLPQQMSALNISAGRGSEFSRSRPSEALAYPSTSTQQPPLHPTLLGDTAPPRTSRWSVTPSISATEDDTLDERYSKRDSRFFSRGRVFAVLWPETAGTPSNTHISQTGHRSYGRFGQEIYSSIRRMVVIREGHGVCWCIPINTYGGQGLKRPSFNKDDIDAHAIIHMIDQQHTYLVGEPRSRKRNPIAVKKARADQKLDPASRLNFARVHSVDHRVKVMDVGSVIPECLQDLEEYWKQHSRV